MGRWSRTCARASQRRIPNLPSSAPRLSIDAPSSDITRCLPAPLGNQLTGPSDYLLPLPLYPLYLNHSSLDQYSSQANALLATMIHRSILRKVPESAIYLSILSIARSLVRVLNSTDRMAGESRDGRESATRAHEARQDRWI